MPKRKRTDSTLDNDLRAEAASKFQAGDRVLYKLTQQEGFFLEKADFAVLECWVQFDDELTPKPISPLNLELLPEVTWVETNVLHLAVGDRISVAAWGHQQGDVVSVEPLVVRFEGRDCDSKISQRDIEQGLKRLWIGNYECSTAMPELVPSAMQPRLLVELPPPNSSKSASSSNQSCDRAFQEFPSTMTSAPSTHQGNNGIYSALESPVLLSPERVVEEQPVTSATCSPTPSDSSNNAALNGSSSKMLSDCSTLPCSPESQQELSLDTYFGPYPAAGTWANGSFSPQPALDCHTVVKGSLSLPTPTALSSKNSRPPGQNKLEAKLKSLGLIAPGKTVNPEFLEMMQGFPRGWTAVALTGEIPAQHCLTDAQLPLLEEVVSLVEEEKSLEILSLSPLQSLSLEEFSTSINLQNEELTSQDLEYGKMVEIVPAESLATGGGEENKLLSDSTMDSTIGGTAVAAEKSITALSLNEIATDGGTQSRLKLNHVTIEDYAEAMQAGVEFPPITVFYDGKIYWLADGFHRVAAARKAFVEDIACEVRQGTRRDAVLYSVGANAAHGLPRSREDKKCAVMTLLHDEEWSKWSDREIARQCHVDHKYVGKLRKEVNGDIPIENRTFVSKHGTIATRRVENKKSTDDFPEGTSVLLKPSHHLNGHNGTITSRPNAETAIVKIEETGEREIVSLHHLQPVIEEDAQTGRQGDAVTLQMVNGAAMQESCNLAVLATEITIGAISSASLLSDAQVKSIFEAYKHRFEQLGLLG